MADPEQLAAGMERLARYARREGRDPAEIEVIYRLNYDGDPEQMAGNIRRYEEMGVSHLVVDFFSRVRDVDDMLSQMEEMLGQLEEMLGQLWPLV